MQIDVMQTYTLHGQDLGVRGEGEARAFVEELLAYKGALPMGEAAAPAGDAPSIVIDAAMREAGGDGLSAPPEDARTFARGTRFWTWVDGGEARVVAEDSEARVSADGCRVDVRFGPGALAVEGDRTVGFYLMTTALLYALAARGWTVLHAAALVPPSAQTRETDAPPGLLLVGDSDSGKSTTSLTLIRHGWGYVSDDTVLLRDGGDAPEVGSYRRDVCVDPDAAALFPELGGRAWPPSPSDASKWRVDLAAVYGDRFRPACAPQAVLFPELVPDAPSCVEPVDERAAVLRLLPQSSLPLLARQPALAQTVFDTVSALVRRTPCYRLVTGRDLLDAATAHALLEPFAAGGGARGGKN